MEQNNKVRVIAYFLPQFHPIPENDLHWGKGFTEWTNVAKAKPLFKGHYQPFLPTELGYYDLRLPEVRKAQADLAREYGIEGFCYWHYWFGNGKRLLELPFKEVVNTNEPDFPFCLCWANHTWSTVWIGDTKKIIAEQLYPGIEDYTNHFYDLLPAFKDKRYIKVGEKLLFSIFSPQNIPECNQFTDIWNSLAKQEGLAGFHFVGMGVNKVELKKYGLNACTPHTPHNLVYQLPIKFLDKVSYRVFKQSFIELKAKLLNVPRVYDYALIVKTALKQKYSDNEYPVAIPNWDHSPRSGKKAFIFDNSTPRLFSKMLQYCIESVHKRQYDNRIVFIKAWNEWAEGNFLEPEARYGREYLEVIKNVVLNNNK